jgi:hypothetical protein
MAKKEEKKDALENVEVLQEKLIGIEGWFEKTLKLQLELLPLFCLWWAVISDTAIISTARMTLPK